MSPRVMLIRVNERLGVHPFLEETNVSGIYPPLGVAYLAAAAREAGFVASILDAHAENLTLVQQIRRIRRFDADVVGITSTTFNWPVAAQLARDLKQVFPGLQVWVGGPQLSLYPDECMTVEAVDVAVIGEGDETLVELLRRLEAGEPLAGVAGTLVRQHGELVRAEMRLPIQDLDQLPMPAIELLPLERYRALTLPTPFTTMVTSRGCPFRCRYCSQVYVGGSYREHGAQRVLDEMERAVTHHRAREVVFFDETFTMKRQRVLDVCEGILGRDLGVRWNIRTRIDRLDDELLEALHAAGCVGIHVGVESGVPRVQKLMNKNLKLDRLASALEGAQRLGLETRGYFMIGFPGETREEIEETIRVARDLPLDWASFTITQPAPGTDIYQTALEEGLYKRDYWRDYTLGVVEEPLGYFTSEGLSTPELEALLHKAYRSFYMRPSMILSKMRNRRLWREIPSTARTMAEIQLAERGAFLWK